MDILSLPDEMCVSVMKYIKFDELRKLRKTSQRIDRLAKRADLGLRIPVKKLGFNLIEDYSIHVVKNYSQPAFQSALSSTWAELKLLEKVSVIDELCFTGLIDETFLAAIQKQQRSFRRIKTLFLYGVTFAPSASVAQAFIRSMGSTPEEIVVWATPASNIDIFCEPEIYSWRTWKYVAIDVNTTENVTLDDNFLFQVVPKCEIYFSHQNTTFTIGGTIAMLKKCLLEDRFDQEFDLGVLVLGNVPHNKVADLFREEFESTCVVKKVDLFIHYQVVITNQEKVCDVHFRLPIERNFNDFQ